MFYVFLKQQSQKLLENDEQDKCNKAVCAVKKQAHNLATTTNLKQLA